jgi:hypothetical protein
MFNKIKKLVAVLLAIITFLTAMPSVAIAEENNNEEI